MKKKNAKCSNPHPSPASSPFDCPPSSIDYTARFLFSDAGDEHFPVFFPCFHPSFLTHFDIPPRFSFGAYNHSILFIISFNILLYPFSTSPPSDQLLKLSFYQTVVLLLFCCEEAHSHQVSPEYYLIKNNFSQIINTIIISFSSPSLNPSYLALLLSIIFCTLFSTPLQFVYHPPFKPSN